MFKNMLLTSAVLSTLTGCATAPDYVTPENVETTQIHVTRDIKAPLIGGTSTQIFNMKAFKKCDEPMQAGNTRFMMLVEGHPLMTNFNENGVNVPVGKPLSLFMFSVSGAMSTCSGIVKFTPESGKNYDIKLNGDLTAINPYCTTELWSMPEGSDVAQQERFEEFDDCQS
ncbi:hypothetical protein [Aliamphritea ceti]|uniref:hypothetical protein n=1 Tax=Aliamphritea ceti TaxID=1524258 RepID=UPI0021C30F94|nr:hypothetical protein [Aliamphritea ceti]